MNVDIITNNKLENQLEQKSANEYIKEVKGMESKEKVRVRVYLQKHTKQFFKS